MNRERLQNISFTVAALAVCLVARCDAQVWQAESLPHQIGRADGDGWSASTDKDPAGYLVYGPYAEILNAGRGCTARVRLMVDNTTANDDPVVRIDAYDATAKKRLALRTIKRKQFAKPWQYQDFQLHFWHEQGHEIEVRTLWLDKSYVRQDSVTVDVALLDARLIQPSYGEEGWRLTGQPMRYPKNISIDPSYWDVTDVEGVTLYERIEEFWLSLGTVCGMGAYKAELSQASIVYQYAPLPVVHRMNGGGPNDSGYFHISGSVIVTSGEAKPAMGGGLLSRNSAIRIPGHATFTAWGWPAQGYPGEVVVDGHGPVWVGGKHAMRSPFMSEPVPPLVDGREHGWLQGFSGKAWLIR